MIGGGKGVRNFASEKARFFASDRGIVACPTVEIYTECQRLVPMLHAELGSHSGKDSGQHVPRAALGHARVSGGVHKSATVRRGENGVKSLEDHMGLPSCRSFPSSSKPVRLHSGVRNAKQPSHLARMRRNRKILSLSLG